MVSSAPHNFVKLTEVNPELADLPKIDISDDSFNYMLELYMEDYIALAIPMSRSQMHHIANAVMTGIHYMFPTDKDNDEDAIYLKKILKKDEAWAVIKNVLGFDFDGNPGGNTIWLTEDLHTNILSKPKKVD